MKDPLQAWQSVLQQLQLEMPRTLYVDRLGPARLLGYRQGTLTIAFPDEAGRSWVEHRLGKTIHRHLTAVLPEFVQVRYVVSAPADRQLNGPFRIDKRESVVHNPPEKHHPAPAHHPAAPIDPDKMPVHILRGLRDAYIRPERVHVMPGYLLRWIPYLGSGPFWTMVGFRQALYEQSGCKPTEDTQFEVSLRRISAIIGANKDTVKSHRDSGKLDWFLDYQATQKYTRDPQTGEARRKAHEYTFRATIPPTPADADILQEWLLDNGFESRPLETLERAQALSPREILGQPAPKPSALQKRRQPSAANRSFLALVLDLCPDPVRPGLRRQIIQAAELLGEQIVQSFGNVFLSHYFMRHWLPLVGPTPGCAIAIARQYGYHNTRTGELREEFVLQQGYAGLAAMLGKSLNTVLQFLPRRTSSRAGKRPGAPKKDMAEMKSENAQRAERREVVRALTSHFIFRSESVGRRRVRLAVKMVEPLTPAHQADYEACLRLISMFLARHGLRYGQQEVDEFLELLAGRGVFSEGVDNIDDPDNIIIAVSDNTILEDQDNENVHVSDDSSADIPDNSQPSNIEISDKDVSAIPDNADFEVSGQIKNLKIKYLRANTLADFLIQLSSTDSNTAVNTLTTERDPTAAVTWSAIPSGGGEWDLQLLFDRLRIPKQARRELLSKDVSAIALVSHILHVFSPQGAGIKIPWRYLASRLRESPQSGHGPRHDRLATLGPGKLQALIRRTGEKRHQPVAQAVGRLAGAGDWSRLIGDSPDHDTLLDLAETLGLCQRELY